MAPRRMLPVVPRFPSARRLSAWCAVAASLAVSCLPRSGAASVGPPRNGLPVIDPGPGFGVPNEPDAPALRGLLVTFGLHAISGPTGIWFSTRPIVVPPHVARTLKAPRLWR